MADDKEKKTVKTIRLPAPEGQRIDELADERDMTEADMYRHLIRTGLDAETDGDGTTETRAFGQAVAFDSLWRGGVALALLVLIVTEVGLL